MVHRKAAALFKRVGFALVATILVLLISEATAVAVYLVHTRRMPSPSQFQRARSSLLGEAPDTRDTPQIVHDLLESPDARPPDQIGAEVLHPYLGFVYSPERNTPAFRAVYGAGISSWGFVDDDIPIHAADPGKVIVGMFGGSVAWYLSTESADTLVSGLKEVPAFRDKQIVIVRTALFGYKQPQQLLALTYLLSMGAHFDIVINLDGFNEVVLPVTENLQKHVFPFYPRTWFVRVADSPASRRVIDRVKDLRAERRSLATVASNPIARRSMTANVMWKLMDESLSNRITMLQINWLKQPLDDGGYAATGPPAAYRTEADLYQDLADKWKSASLQMNRLARANGAAYFHFLQPNQYVPGSKPMTADEKALAIDEGFMFAQPARTGYPYLIAAGRQLAADGVWYQDLTGLFSKLPLPVYRDNCCHFKKRGNEIIAATIASAIAAKFAR